MNLLTMIYYTLLACSKAAAAAPNPLHDGGTTKDNEKPGIDVEVANPEPTIHGTSVFKPVESHINGKVVNPVNVDGTDDAADTNSATDETSKERGLNVEKGSTMKRSTMTLNDCLVQGRDEEESFQPMHDNVFNPMNHPIDVIGNDNDVFDQQLLVTPEIDENYSVNTKDDGKHSRKLRGGRIVTVKHDQLSSLAKEKLMQRLPTATTHGERVSTKGIKVSVSSDFQKQIIFMSCDGYHILMFTYS